MRKQTVTYSHREYDSRITTDTVQRCYFGSGQAHQITTQRIKNQLTEMLGWITEHMVLPTEPSRIIANWALEQDTVYKTKTTIPRDWDITDPRVVWTNPRTGSTKHTRPCAIGVLGGMVLNSLTQREFTEPQIQGLNHLFATMITEPGDDRETLWPSHWTAYNFVREERAQREEQSAVDRLFS